jgi:2-keto-4-pentenoate hydratase
MQKTIMTVALLGQLAHRAKDGYPMGSAMVRTFADRLAVELAGARLLGCLLDPAQVTPLPTDLARAYEVQAQAASLRGDAVVAYKIGLTNPKAQQAMGVAEPIAGRLVQSDLRASPAAIEVGTHLKIVEAEIVFQMEQALPAGTGPFSEAEVARCVGGAFAGIEICNSRFPDEGETAARIVADNSNADLLVVGERLQGWTMEALADLPVRLTGSKRADVIGSTANVLGHPLKALTWLANWLAERGEALKPGHLVATGSCTGMTELAFEEEITAIFGSLGRASLKFVLKKGPQS